MTAATFLSDSWRWLGAHSSYDRLPGYVRQLDGSVRVTVAPPRFMSRLSRLLDAQPLHRRRHWGYYPGSDRAFVRQLNARPATVGHILYFERHHRMLARWRDIPQTIVATLHFRPSPDAQPRFYQDLRRLPAAIVLYQRDLAFFTECLDSRRVMFIRHGVDTEFFTPAPTDAQGPRRLLYIGVNGRDIHMLREVVRRLAESTDLRFDFVVPRGRHLLRDLERCPQIHWHHNISDDQLRMLYRNSYLLLLPLTASGANNAVVEALACALPPVTTDVGGIRDYGGGTLYPVVAPHDAEAMVRVVQEYLRDPERRQQVGRDCRAFAEQCLSWRTVAEQHLRFYRQLLNG